MQTKSHEQDRRRLRREFEKNPALVRQFRREPLAEFRCTDLGNAELFAERYSDRLRYCPEFNKWLEWDARRWNRDTTGAVYRHACDYVRQLYADASKIADEKRRTELAHWAIRCEDRRKLDAMLALAKNLSAFVVSADELDADAFALNVLDGTLDLRTGQLRPHQQSDLITRLAPVEFGVECSSTYLYKFLRRIFADDAETIRFVQRAFGHCLTGDTSEQVLFIMHGNGANGKSTLLTLFQHCLGDYALSTPTDTLLSKREAGGIPNDVARLKGARFVAAQETEDGRRLAESRVKAFTGGDKITARFMRAEWFDFDPTFKLWLSTNHKPEIKNADHAIWRRIRLIPFSVTIPDSERDPHLLDKLQAEAPAVLKWALIGCLDWQKHGLGIPDSVATATADYRADSDVLGAFIDESCVHGEAFETPAGRLYSEYRRWADDNGQTVVNSTAFGRRMVERGFEKRRASAGVIYLGIGLRAVYSSGAV